MKKFPQSERSGAFVRLTVLPRLGIFIANVPRVYTAMTANNNDIKQIHIKLGSNLHQALKLEAAYSDTTIQDLVVTLIKQRILRGEFANMVEDE